MPQCVASKPDGTPCERIVGASHRYCYSHDPQRSEERKQHAMRGGRGKLGASTKEIRDLKAQLGDLADDVLAGRVKRGDAAVIVQILNSRARLIELERKIREQAVIEERLEELERIYDYGGNFAP